MQIERSARVAHRRDHVVEPKNRFIFEYLAEALITPGQLTTHHRGHNVLLFVAQQRRRFDDALTVSKYRHRVAHGEDFFEFVADKQHDGALVLEFPHDLKKPVCSRAGYGRRRLIQEQHFCVGHDGFGDFHQLHLRHGEVLGDFFRDYQQPQRIESFFGQFGALRVIDDAPTVELFLRDNVCCHREIGN